MLAYASSRPTAASRQSSPNTLLFIISAHVALAALVMSMKMDLPQHIRDRGTDIIFIPQPVDPPPNPEPAPRSDHPAPTPAPNPVPPRLPLPHDTTLDPGPTIDPGPMIGGGSSGSSSGAGLGDPIKLAPVRHDARLLTPPSELRPPYPASKLAAEEEAMLNLRLTIDRSGRVIGVEPLGRADPVFVAAARRHLLAYWHYAPATDDGAPVASTLTIVLRFRLDG